jgi:hypothetical protein
METIQGDEMALPKYPLYYKWVHPNPDVPITLLGNNILDTHDALR